MTIRKLVDFASLTEDDREAISGWLRTLARNEGDMAVSPRRRGRRIIAGWCHYCGAQIAPDLAGNLTLGHEEQCFVLVARRVMGMEG